MKAWSVMGLLFGAAILGTIAISPHVTQRGVELRVDQAQAQVLTGATAELTDVLTAPLPATTAVGSPSTARP